MKILICSAFFRELKYVLKHIDSLKKLKSKNRVMFPGKYNSNEIMAVQTGMGTRNAEYAVMESLKEFEPDIIISSGFGGALYRNAAIGDLVCAERCFMMSGDNVDILVNPYGNSLFSMNVDMKSICKGDIMTLGTWMRKTDVFGKLPQGMSSPVCDMETFPIARISMERNIPFFAFRSVTDRLNEEIPAEFTALTDSSGRYRLSEAVKTVMRSPLLVRDMVRLGRSSDTASKRIWYAVRFLLEVLPDGR